MKFTYEYKHGLLAVVPFILVAALVNFTLDVRLSYIVMVGVVYLFVYLITYGNQLFTHYRFGPEALLVGGLFPRRIPYTR